VRSPQRQNENNISRPFRLRLTLAVVGFRRIKLGKTSSSYRDAVDRISLFDSLAGDGIPALAQSGQRRPVVCGSHPVASIKFVMVAPSDRCSRSITRASLLPARGAKALAGSPMTSGPVALVA
jgi:hypothetical protein